MAEHNSAAVFADLHRYDPIILLSSREHLDRMILAVFSESKVDFFTMLFVPYHTVYPLPMPLKFNWTRTFSTSADVTDAPQAVILSRWRGGSASLNNYKRGRPGHFCTLLRLNRPR